MGGHDSDSSVGPGLFFFHASGFSCLFIFLLFVKFISNTFGSQPCRTHSHQREIPTYCLCWVVLGLGWVGLSWVGLGCDRTGFGLELGWVGLEPRSLMTTKHHPSVVLTAADVFQLFYKNCHEVTGGTQPFGHILVYIW